MTERMNQSSEGPWQQNDVTVVAVLVYVEVVSVDPQFDTLLSNVTVVRGETATLPCSIDSLGKFKVSQLR